MNIEIINTSDGSHTLFVPGMNEQYHSVNGAITESEYVYIDKGYRFNESAAPVVFEVGFGTGLNCLLTAIEAERSKRKTTCFTVEKYPLTEEITGKLNYGNLISAEAEQIFKKIHNCPWNTPVDISEYFRLIKIETNLITDNLNSVDNFDIIYFDAFGPDKQPEMWTPSIFEKIYSKARYNAVFVTYSAKGEVRRQLARCGFEMERLAGPPGKKQMLRGIKLKQDN